MAKRRAEAEMGTTQWRIHINRQRVEKSGVERRKKRSLKRGKEKRGE